MLRPRNDNVILERIKPQNKSAGGIHLPENTRVDKETEGVVIAVGEGKALENGDIAELDLKEGNVVVFRGRGQPYMHGGKEYLILSEKDILAIVS